MTKKMFLKNMVRKYGRKSVLFLVLLSAFATQVGAKSLSDLWVSMPDSLLPAISKSQRIEFVDLKNLGVKAEVDNLLGEICHMDSLSANYLKVTTSESSTLEMRLLPFHTDDSLLCVIRTFSAPEKESELRFYDQEWNGLELNSFLPSNALDESLYWKAKPDTMSVERLSELQRMIEPKMFSFAWAEGGRVLVMQLSLPLLSKDEKSQVNALLVQRKFKWVNGRLNEI